MTTIRYSTTSWPQEFALEKTDSKTILLRLDKNLFEETEGEPTEIGDLTTFLIYDSETYSDPHPLFQAEFYFESIDSDAFAKRGLIPRKTKVQLELPIEGIVFSANEEGLLLRPEEMLSVTTAIEYHLNHGRSFAGYFKSRREVRYLSPNSDSNPRILNPLTTTDQVIRTRDNEMNVEYEYWGQRTSIGTKTDEDTELKVPAYVLSPLELVIRREALNTGLEISIRREGISLARANGEKIEMQGDAIDALKEAIKWFESFYEDEEKKRVTRHLRPL